MSFRGARVRPWHPLMVPTLGKHCLVALCAGVREYRMQFRNVPSTAICALITILRDNDLLHSRLGETNFKFACFVKSNSPVGSFKTELVDRWCVRSGAYVERKRCISNERLQMTARSVLAVPIWFNDEVCIIDEVHFADGSSGLRASLPAGNPREPAFPRHVSSRP